MLTVFSVSELLVLGTSGVVKILHSDSFWTPQILQEQIPC